MTRGHSRSGGRVRERASAFRGSHLNGLAALARGVVATTALAFAPQYLYQAKVMTPMQAFVRTCLAQPSFTRQRTLLSRIVQVPRVHARWLNTLARLEYVGVRKMLKTRPSTTLDLDGLRHVLEEAAHATRLKKAALAVAPEPSAVRTFSDEHTLCGDAAERYFQNLDREAARLLEAARTVGAREEACYLMTSTAIELRAKSFYPTYQAVLEDAGSAVSVASIIGDEEAHLEHMAAALPTLLPTWERVLEEVMRREESEFNVYLDQVEATLNSL